MCVYACAPACVCIQECKQLQGQVTARTHSPSSSPLMLFVSSSSLLCTLGELFYFLPGVSLSSFNHPTTWQLFEKMLRANWINTTVYGLGTYQTQMHLREPTEWFVTEQRTWEMEPGHDHRTGVICHLPEELTAQPTGKGVNSQVLEVNYIVVRDSGPPLWLRLTFLFAVFLLSSKQIHFLWKNASQLQNKDKLY